MKIVIIKPDGFLESVNGKPLMCPIKTQESYCGSWCAFFDTEVVSGYCGKPSETRVTCKGRSLGILEDCK
jgi:hypothetical protein